jgi:hypothetical protein
MTNAYPPDGAERYAVLQAHYTLTLERLMQRTAQLDLIPCPQTWRSTLHLLRAETADYLQTALLPEPLRDAFEHLYVRIDAAERYGWRVPPSLLPWQP